MIKAYKYKLNPTFKQKKHLAQDFGNVRFIYNWGLGIKKEKWEKENISLSYFDLSKMLTELKHDGEHDWLKNTACGSLQQALRHLDAAYAKFFKEKRGFPKFKSKKNLHDSIQYMGCKFNFASMKVFLPKIGEVKFCKNQVFDLSKVKTGTVTVSRDNCNNYWCCVVVDNFEENKTKAEIKDDETCVGIDLGVKNLCILNNGKKYDNPKYLKHHLERLKKLQQQLSIKTKDSNNYNKLKLKIAKLHNKIHNMRTDYLHKVSSEIINEFDTICLETLNVKGMVRNHSLAQAVSDVSLGEFNNMLTYNGEWQGKNIIHIGRFEPSSKTCNKCGYINKDLTLGDREWVCPVCGEYHDRDINAAINIRKIGLKQSA